jgi:citrate synthase
MAAAALTALSGDALAGAYEARMGMVQLYSSSDGAAASATPRNVVAGQMVMITGDCVEKSGKVNVVLSLAEDEPSNGWHDLLVTDMELQDGNLHMRVPNMPHARNHVFRVRVFAGEGDPCVCEAGQIRIG